ncbi:glutathione gamma-glutamylcysteinyltransferase 1-like isoform X2 [Benincasa hispida]|uniref:glutathione gamma-glutamylcysteinyltransferase 1-like isoform X2 n=1 Tax=Benincasa hispida TaxID=102211 RepID=UPI0019029418|nr:glutathione gamma-glutamylcysteinyltransferase 1-like isoform X2 [Benincasa hispida]
MAMAGLYRRILPSPPAIEFASSEGKQLFIEAVQHGTMEGFYRLVSYFQTQSEPEFCGLASLSMVLNALAIDPGRKWKGPWRWFDESMLDCCEPLEKVKARGISLGKLVCLANCAGAKVQAFRTNQSTIDDFRKYLHRCSTLDDCHIISSYHRVAFKQTGTGHFSPIGGYHVGQDMALILDVARFKYPPHWVPVKLLWKAMEHIDEATGQRRGFMLISRPDREPGLLYTLSCKHEDWVNIAKYLKDDVPLLLKSENLKDTQDVLTVIFASLPLNYSDFIKWVAEVRRREDSGQSLSPEEKARLALKEEVLKQVQETDLFKLVGEFLTLEGSCRKMLTLSHEKNLPEIAASVCCQGAEILNGNTGVSAGYCCRETCVRCFSANGDKPVTVVCGMVVNGNNEQEFDMLVPSSSQVRSGCCFSGTKNGIGIHPATSDVLTTLLLALPAQTWIGIKEEKLLREVQKLVCTESLPTLLQEEVLHLRRQLHLLQKYHENKVDLDLSAPPSS